MGEGLRRAATAANETRVNRHRCIPGCPPEHREHLNHMTDGRWHDNCRFCLRRREKGGNGLEGEPLGASTPAPHGGVGGTDA